MENEKEFDLGTEEGRKKYQTVMDKREGLYIAQQLLIDKIGELDKELSKFGYKWWGIKDELQRESR